MAGASLETTAAGAVAVHAPAAPARRSWVDHTLDAVLGVALLGELIVLFGNVIARSLFHYSFAWSQEIAQLALTVLTFVGGAVAYRRGEHMAVQAVVERLPRSWRPAIAALNSWLVFAMAALAGVLSVPLLISRWSQLTPALGIHYTWFGVGLTVGMGLLALFALEQLWHQPGRTVIATGAAVVAVAALLYLTQAAWGPALDGNGALWVCFAFFAAMLALGVPIGFVLPLCSLIYLFGSDNAPVTAVPLNMQGGISSFVLLAVPFFILAGFIMTEGGLSKPLASFVRSLVGHLRGGLLQVIVISMYIFSGISGSKVADVAAVGTTMNDMLKEEGYEPAETVAVLAASAVMGETVPPSIAMLILGSITTLSMGALFVAGVLPAVVMALCLMVLVYIRSRRSGLRPGTRYSWAQRGKSLISALPALMVPLILVGGILLGVATPTEVSSFAVIYALLAAVLAYRSISFQGFWRLLSNTASMAGMILFIISSGACFSWALTVANLPDQIKSLLDALGGSQVLFVLVAVVVLVVMGALLEGLPALLIFAPLFLPLSQQFGINELQMSIVLIFAMGLGAFAPPVGIGLYVACSVGGASMEKSIPHLLPYMLVLLVGLLLVAFVPWFSLVLPAALHLGG